MTKMERKQSSGEALKSRKQDILYDMKALEDSLMENLTKVIKEKNLEITKTRSRNEEMDKSLRDAQSKLENAKIEKEEALEKLRGMDQELISTTIECSNHLDENNVLCEKISHLERDQNELRENITRLEDRAKEFFKEKENAEIEKEETKKKLQAMEQELIKVTDEKQMLCEQISQLERSRNELREKDKMLEDQAREFLKKQESLESQSKETEARYEKEIEGLEEDVRRLSIQNESYKSAMEEKDDEIRKLRADLAMVKGQDMSRKRPIENCQVQHDDHSYVKSRRLSEGHPGLRENDSSASKSQVKPVLTLKSISCLRAGESEHPSTPSRHGEDHRAGEREELRAEKDSLKRLKQEVAGHVKNCLMKVYGKGKLLKTESDFESAAKYVSVKAREEIMMNYLMTNDNLAGVTMTEDDKNTNILPRIVSVLTLRDCVVKCLQKCVGASESERLTNKFVEEFQDKILESKGKLSAEDFRRDYEYSIITSVQLSLESKQ